MTSKAMVDSAGAGRRLRGYRNIPPADAQRQWTRFCAWRSPPQTFRRSTG
ncbi:MAG: hypothetical protein HY260_17205 [Chloroflexi bacterium]|nr:hypothetical protein [Chloroflexota bacterium]